MEEENKDIVLVVQDGQLGSTTIFNIEKEENDNGK